ncbi:MAG: putative metalloprotease CJM1_0395 family protein [Colwellia sp.]
MNITPHTASLPLATVVNPPTDSLRRDNHQREIITQVTAANPSAAEKAVASDKERARTPAQVNEEVDFANLRKQAEHAASSISEQESQQGDQENTKKNQDEQANTNSHASKNGNAESDNTSESNKQTRTDEIIIQQLQEIDKEVRAHELAHASMGGASTGSPSYTFEVGPDGKKYAVSGEVPVDLTSVPNDPQATIDKMQKVYASALAPATPSTQDIQVAASAKEKISSAQTELLALDKEKDAQSSSTSINKDTQTHAIFNTDDEGNQSNTFDSLINQTLTAQTATTASAENQEIASLSTDILQSNQQSYEVIQRAHRIESFYFTISQGYEKPDNFQFELTA